MRKLKEMRASTLMVSRLRNRSYLYFCIEINMGVAGGMRGWWKHRYYFNGKLYL